MVGWNASPGTVHRVRRGEGYRSAVPRRRTQAGALQRSSPRVVRSSGKARWRTRWGTRTRGLEDVAPGRKDKKGGRQEVMVRGFCPTELRKRGRTACTSP